MKRKGYTIVEIMIAVFCTTLVIALASSLVTSSFKYQKTNAQLSDNIIGKTNAIVVLEEALNGVEEVEASDTELRIITAQGEQVIKSDDFMNIKDLEFSKSGDSVIVIINGGATCIPIIYKH